MPLTLDDWMEMERQRLRRAPSLADPLNQGQGRLMAASPVAASTAAAPATPGSSPTIRSGPSGAVNIRGLLPGLGDPLNSPVGIIGGNLLGGVLQALPGILPNQAQRRNRERLGELRGIPGLSGQQEDALRRRGQGSIQAAADQATLDRRRLLAGNASAPGAVQQSILADEGAARAGEMIESRIQDADLSMQESQRQEQLSRQQLDSAFRRDRLDTILGAAIPAAQGSVAGIQELQARALTDEEYAKQRLEKGLGLSSEMASRLSLNPAELDVFLKMLPRTSNAT